MGQSALLPDLFGALAVSGTYAYLAGVWNWGLVVVDVSAPEAPRMAGLLTGAGGVEGIALSGHYNFLATAYGLSIVDVSQPDAPVQVGTLATPDAVHDVALRVALQFSRARRR